MIHDNCLVEHSPFGHFTNELISEVVINLIVPRVPVFFIVDSDYAHIFRGEDQLVAKFCLFLY